MDPAVWDNMNKTLGDAPGSLGEQTYAYGERPGGGPAPVDTALRNIAVPVLLLIGGEDWIFADPTKDIGLYPATHAEQHIIPETGHFLFHHAPREEPMAFLDAWLLANAW